MIVGDLRFVKRLVFSNILLNSILLGCLVLLCRVEKSEIDVVGGLYVLFFSGESPCSVYQSSAVSHFEG